MCEKDRLGRGIFWTVEKKPPRLFRGKIKV